MLDGNISGPRLAYRILHSFHHVHDLWLHNADLQQGGWSSEEIAYKLNQNWQDRREHHIFEIEDKGILHWQHIGVQDPFWRNIEALRVSTLYGESDLMRYDLIKIILLSTSMLRFTRFLFNSLPSPFLRTPAPSFSPLTFSNRFFFAMSIDKLVDMIEKEKH